MSNQMTAETETRPNLTANEMEFLAAAQKQQDNEGMFCYLDALCHGYSRDEVSAQATFGSLVKKGVVAAPTECGWSTVLH